MKENEYKVNLANISEIFDNKTFRYRINAFAYACGMEDVGVVRNGEVLFSSDYSEETGYFISCNEDENKKCIILSGHYKDLVFTFTNYYDNLKKLNHHIIDIPFSISLEKKVDDVIYQFNIETVDGIRTKFVINKYHEFKDRTLQNTLAFYSNVMDFSKVLKIIKSFVYNPDLVFMTYNEVMEKQKIVFTNNMLDKMVMQDEKLDKPTGKVRKLIKKIMD